MLVKDLEDIFLKPLKTIASLDIEHPLKSYCIDRKIPEKYYASLFAVENLYQWLEDKPPIFFLHVNELVEDLNYIPGNIIKKPKKLAIETFNYPSNYIIFPHRDFDQSLASIIIRKIDVNSKVGRFFHFYFNNTKPLAFGLERVDLNKKIYICEGYFDSFLLENSICVSGILNIKELLAEEWFKKIKKSKVVFVLDHDIDNWMIYSWSVYLTKQGYKICDLPFWFKKSDLNDLIKSGWSLSAIRCLVYINSQYPAWLSSFTLRARWKIKNFLKSFFSFKN